MTDSTGHKMVAPYLTAEKMMEPEGFRRHYETWRQFSVVKGVDAPWLKRTMDPEVIEALEANHGTQFGVDEAQKKGEPDEDYIRRKEADAEQVAKSIYLVAAPKGTAASRDFISKACRWDVKTLKTNGMSLTLYSSMHRVRFKQRSAQLGDEHRTEQALIKAYLACFHRKMEAELKHWSKEKKVTSWTQLAQHVQDICVTVEKAEHYRLLLGLGSPGNTQTPTPTNSHSSAKAGEKKASKKDDESKDERKCFTCGKTGHVKANCPMRNAGADASKGRSSENSESKNKSTTPARSGDVRRSGRERTAPERYGFSSSSAKKWLAAAVKKMSAEEIARLQESESDAESHAGSETDEEASENSD